MVYLFCKKLSYDGMDNWIDSKIDYFSLTFGMTDYYLSTNGDIFIDA